MIAVNQESRYENLKKLARDLHIPVAEAFWQLEVRDRNGRLLRTHRQRSHSWVRNTYNLLLCQAAAVPSDSALGLAIVDTGGTARSDSSTQPASGWSSSGAANMRIYVGSTYGFYAHAGVDSMGIVVGTGNGAENFNDHSLGSKVPSGNGAGQLAYSTMDAPSVSTVGASRQVVWIRYFNNNSGATITVNEAGIYTKGTVDGSIVYYMMCRDLLAGGVDVPETGQLKVTYTVQLTYPA